MFNFFNKTSDRTGRHHACSAVVASTCASSSWTNWATFCCIRRRKPSASFGGVAGREPPSQLLGTPTSCPPLKPSEDAGVKDAAVDCRLSGFQRPATFIAVSIPWRNFYATQVFINFHSISQGSSFLPCLSPSMGTIDSWLNIAGAVFVLSRCDGGVPKPTGRDCSSRSGR